MSSNIFYSTASIIPDRQTFLKRPHIHQLLEKSIQKPVTTVVAGAGYGKTQAVYGFLSEYDAITLWTQFSTFDNLVMRFWEKAINIISLHNKQLALKLKLLGFPETIDAFDRFLLLLSSEMKQGRKYVLAYDDFHLVYEKSILKFLEKIIGVQLPNLSIIFISRTEPNINTIGLLSKGLLSYINEDTLRFNQNDMIQYFRLQNIQLSSKAITDIYRYTDGWIFAIHLVGLSQKSGLTDESHALSAAKENISKLIENEVFSVMSKKLQNFLIRLSLLDNLPLALIEELSSDNPECASEILKVSSFIRYDPFLNTYRIHHLLLEFLNKKQKELKANDKKKIYRQAANWYAKNDYKIDAITFYEKTKSYDEITKIILSYPSLVPPETADFLLEVIERAAKEKSVNKSVLELLHTRFLVEKYKFTEARAELLALQKEYEPLPPVKENTTALCGIYSNLGIISIYSGTNEFVQYFKLAYDTGSQIIKHDYSLAVLSYACRVTCCDEEAFGSYIQSLETAMPYAIYALHGYGAGYADLAKAEFAYFQKDFKNTEKYTIQAMEQSHKNQQYSIESMAIFYLIRMYTALGNYREIISLLNKLKVQTEKNNFSYCYMLFDIIEGWFYASTDQTDKVSQSLKDIGGNGNKSINEHGLKQLVWVRCCLSKKQYHKVLALLENYEDDFGFGHLVLGQIETKLLTAICLYYVHEHEKAIATLEAAYMLAAPNHLDMPFIEQGNHIRGLVKTALRSEKRVIPKQWLEAIYTKTSTYAKSISRIVSEIKLSNGIKNKVKSDFTKKELELLKDLCYGLSREEMAINNNISIHTVNSTLQLIYTKLGAINALDAVRLATLLKLVT